MCIITEVEKKKKMLPEECKYNIPTPNARIYVFRPGRGVSQPLRDVQFPFCQKNCKTTTVVVCTTVYRISCYTRNR